MNNKLIKGLALAGALSVASGAGAVSLDPGPLKIKFQNWEDILGDLVNPVTGLFDTTALCAAPPCSGLANGTQDLRGIFNITSLLQGPAFINQQLGAGDKLWGVFYGFDVDSIAVNGTGLKLGYVGGSFDVFKLGADFNPFVTGVGEWTGTSTYKSINDGNMDGVSDTPWLSFNFDLGVAPGVTLDVNIDGGTVPATGDGTGYMSVGTTANGTGTDNSSFDQNSIFNPADGLYHDAFLQNDFRTPVSDINGDGVEDTQGFPCTSINGPGVPGPCVQYDGGWDLTSDDPVLTAVPEPGVLALMGLGLLSMIGFGRRSRKS